MECCRICTTCRCQIWLYSCVRFNAPANVYKREDCHVFHIDCHAISWESAVRLECAVRLGLIVMWCCAGLQEHSGQSQQHAAAAGAAARATAAAATCFGSKDCSALICLDHQWPVIERQCQQNMTLDCQVGWVACILWSMPNQAWGSCTHPSLLHINTQSLRLRKLRALRFVIMQPLAPAPMQVRCPAGPPPLTHTISLYPTLYPTPTGNTQN